MSELSLQLGQDETDAHMRYARTLLARAGLCLKLSTMHALDNAAMVTPVKSLVDAVGEGFTAGTQLCLQVVGENFFLNREIVKLDFTSYEAAQSFKHTLERLGAQELAFRTAVKPEELRYFLSVFQKHFTSPTPQEILKHDFPGVRLRAISKAEEEALSPTVDPRKNLLRAYAQLALVIEQQLQLLKAKKAARLAKVRRAIHSLADASVGFETLLLALTRFDAFAGQVRFHLAATTAITMMLGKRLALNRSELSEACMAAAFHDFALDEVVMPVGPRGFEQELAALARVPLRTILRMCEGALAGDALERIAVAWEHSHEPNKPVGFAELIAIPCVFDRLTRPTPPRKALQPDEALRIILNQAGKRFDARLVTLFASVVGLYPVGTTVRLDTGEIGIVVEVPSQPGAFARPRLKIVRTAQGPADYLVDLAAAGERRAIASSVDPAELQLNVPQFLLA